MWPQAPMLAVVLAGLPLQAPPDLPVSGTLETVLVDRVVWPVRFQPLEAGGCRDISTDQIEVREDGRAMRVTEVGRERVPTLHVLLVDTSGSLLSRFKHARRAAEDYLRAVPPADQVLFATFDENLRLWAGPTRDTTAVIDMLGRIGSANRRYTSLWDATYNLLSYLEGFPARKALVVVTDGCDSLSLSTHTFEATLDRAARARDLTVFPVGVGSMGNCSYTGEGTEPLQSKAYLLELARRTGGELFRARTGKNLFDAFRGIMGRLNQEGYVVWDGLPFGEGPRDRPERNDERWRTVKVRARPATGCRIQSAGPPQRLVPKPETLQFSMSRSRLQAVDGRLVGTILDIVVERGQLYDGALSREMGRPIINHDRPPLVIPLEIDFRVPFFGALRNVSPEPGPLLVRVMERCLARPACALGDERVPWLVQGQTYFALQSELALALAATPGYGDWARGRIRRDREQRAERLLREAEAASGHAVTDETRQAVREAILGEAIDVLEIRPYLGQWMGDVDAASLASGLETRASGDPELSRRLRRVWPLFNLWFGPPTQWRAVTVLEPVLDPARETVGLWRVHLPRPEPDAIPVGLIPARPVALEFLDWARGPEGLGSLAAGDVRIDEVRYGPVTSTERRRLVDWHRRVGRRDPLDEHDTLWRVSLDLAPEGDPEALPQTLRVLFPLHPAALGDLAPLADLDPARVHDARERPGLGEGAFCVRILPDRPADRSPLGRRIGLELQTRDRDCPP